MNIVTFHSSLMREALLLATSDDWGLEKLSHLPKVYEDHGDHFPHEASGRANVEAQGCPTPKACVLSH